jgi:hypothetical protein
MTIMDLPEIIANITRGIDCIYSITKSIQKDEFTHEENKDRNNIMMVIPGAHRFVRFPAGFVSFIENNMWIYLLSHMHFIVKYKVIPFSNMNLPNIMKIRRSNGTIQDAYFDSNNGFFMDDKNKSLTIGCRFESDNDGIPSKYSDMEKVVKISDLIELNHLTNIEYSLKSITNKILFDTPFKRKCLEYYSIDITQWNIDIVQPFLKIHNISITCCD